MSPSTPLPRRVARLGVLLAGVLTAGLIGLPAAHADTITTANLVLLPGQSGPIGRVVSNTDVTPVSTCDPELTVSFDATMNGTVHVGSNATAATYTCTVDFQISGQPTGLYEQVSVTIGPGLSINDVSNLEGVPDTFTVALSMASSNLVAVDVSTAHGTADPPSDYNPVRTTLVFQPGETSKTVTVSTIQDSIQEADETFFVRLNYQVNAILINSLGTGTILNDDTQ
ncbi:MAG TPA: Calx-beta domain-containing protein [Mycobacteriales bacterium]|nr:Calx-beta domain-containing protein [Mycobacteriales bacterium]